MKERRRKEKENTRPAVFLKSVANLQQRESFIAVKSWKNL
jgi:hypothetical protein